MYTKRIKMIAILSFSEFNDLYISEQAQLERNH